MRVTRVWLSVAVALALLALSGCIRLRTDVVITSDAQVTVAVDMGTKKNASNPTASPCSADGGMLPQNSKREPYDDGTYVGCRITATGPASSLGSGITVTHANEKFTFRFVGADPTNGKPLDPSVLTDFQVRVSFPGKVLSASGGGVVEGTTVTWTDPKELAAGGLVAVAEDGVGLRAYLPHLIGGVAALLLVVIALGAYVGGRSRASRAPTSPTSPSSLRPLQPLPPKTMVMPRPPAAPPTPSTEVGSDESSWARPRRNPWDVEPHSGS